MILVDSSVWITQLRNLETVATRKLSEIEGSDEIIVGDLILLEVLQGAHNDNHASLIERGLRQFRIERLLDDDLAVQAARHHRRLRERGITVRKTIDLIIGSFCLARGHVLLHDDRDFDPMVTHLGLRVL